jgi:hypothetical protein
MGFYDYAFGLCIPPRGIRASDQWIRIRLRILIFSSLTFKTPPKNNFFLSFYAYYFRKVRLHHFSHIKSNKEVTKHYLGINVFLTFFA